MEVIALYIACLSTLIMIISIIIVHIGNKEPVQMKKKVRPIKIKVNTSHPTMCNRTDEWLVGTFEVREANHIGDWWDDEEDDIWYFIEGTRTLGHVWLFKRDCTVIPQKRLIGGNLL